MEEASGERSKRRRVDITGRLAALAKLKELKGKKNKVEIKSIQNVFDIVDESAYADKVIQQASESWIEEDGNTYLLNILKTLLIGLSILLDHVIYRNRWLH